MNLEGKDFSQFFEAIWGFRPFPWQVRLAEQVCDTDAWPDLLDLPTGSGKTAAIDVAVFWQAVDAVRPPSERRAPRRVLLIVDRRVVVDQAWERARKIAEKLKRPTHPVLRTVAERLRSLWDGDPEDEPLATAVLRGGTVRDEAWARRPDIPLVAASTVDQVGSRLLFRGYGVSGKMRSVHAGLLGNDVLLLLDEVHLSQPFEQTLDAVRRIYRRGAGAGLPDRFVVVPMSATPASGGTDAFGLEATDLSDPVLRSRLQAHKPVELSKPVRIPRTASAAQGHALWAEAAKDQVAGMLQEGLRTVAVIVNRVAAARACHQLFQASWGDQVILLTGRMRPLDKDGVVRRVEAALDGGERVIVVATQCIEAGADFDFDGLVTECASLDALRQRFGRLNRMGRDVASRGVVLVRSDQARNSEKDPVYGPALAATWGWLSDQDDLDFGILALEERVRVARRTGALQGMLAPRADAPALLPRTLELWAQTHPAPFPDPDPALWLHGPDRGLPEVSLVWRADLTEEMLTSARANEARQRDVIARLKACPPGSLEALPVPLFAVRAWLEKADEIEISDAPEAAGEEARGRRRSRPVVRWAGAESALGGGADLRPGDVVVVPTTYGGLRAQVWDPTSEEPVVDLGDRVQLLQRGRPVLRLNREVLACAGLESLSVPSTSSTDPDADVDEALDTWLAEVAALATEPWLRVTAELLQRRRGRTVIDLSDGWGPLLRGRRSLSAADLRARLGDEGEVEAMLDLSGAEDDDASFIDREVTLARHSADVERWARGLAERSGLPGALVDALALAGWLHDVGKADPRFQQMLHGGSAVATAMDDAPLAKSALPSGDRRARERARALSRYPRRTRHELLSLELIRENEVVREQAGEHWELVQHLVASHHGWCRPFAPAVGDRHPVQVALQHGGLELTARSDHALARLDSGIVERFERLNRQYGWWGLAWLEAILRLADHRASEEAQRAGEGR